jgi:hypothetical protein
MIPTLRYHGLAPRGYYQAPPVGLHEVDGFLFAALCVLGLLCAGSVAFLSYPKVPSASSAISAVRSVPLSSPSQ